MCMMGRFAYAHAAHVIHAAVTAVVVVHVAVFRGGIIMAGVVHGQTRILRRGED